MSGFIASTARTAGTVLSRPGGGIFVFLVIISTAMSLATPSFLTVGNWMNILNQSVFLMLLAIGMTYALMGGGIDLSVGSTAALVGAVVAWLTGQADFPLWLALFLGAISGVGLGTLNGLIITRLQIPDFVTTLAMMAFLRGVLYVWTEGTPFVGYSTGAFWTIGGLTRIGWGLTVPMVVTAAIAVVGIYSLRYARFGRHLRAVGDNPAIARLSGVNTKRIKVISFMVSGFAAGLVGIMLAGRFGTVQPNMAMGMEIEALAAAIMGGAALRGGKGSVLGACLGALTLTVIQNVINLLDVPPVFETVVVGGVILVVISVDRLVAVYGARGRAAAAY